MTRDLVESTSTDCRFDSFLVAHPENGERDHEDFDTADMSIEEFNQRRGYDQHDIDNIHNSLDHVSHFCLNHRVCTGA